MSNSTWVCFGCRITVRRYAQSQDKAVCPECGQLCTDIGYKISVPSKNKVKEWEQLRLQWAEKDSKKEQSQNLSFVRRKHELEQEIARLEAMPANEGRGKAIKLLRKKLKELKA